MGGVSALLTSYNFLMDHVNNTEGQLASLNKIYHACLEKQTASFLQNPAAFKLPQGAHEFCEDEKVAVYSFMRDHFKAEFLSIQKVEKNLFF